MTHPCYQHKSWKRGVQRLPELYQQARNQGGFMDNLKNLDPVSENSSPRLVSQAGYGPDISGASWDTWSLGDSNT